MLINHKFIHFFAYIFLSLELTSHCFSQAVLPTNSSFTTTVLPTGWSSSGISYYASSGNTPPSMKFDATGDYLEIAFSGVPGALSYFLAGNSFVAGSFSVEESSDGSSWSLLHDHTNPPASVYQQFTDIPQVSSRFIRFRYVTKVSGNIGLDDVVLLAGSVGPEPEINVLYQGGTVLSNGVVQVASPVGTATTFQLTVQNLGTTNPLLISSVSFGGINASEFSLISAPTSVPATGSASILFSFQPQLPGTRNAQLSILSNDADESSYTINLDGAGGGVATEPIQQPSNLVFTDIKTYRLGIALSPASSTSGILLLRKESAPITELPVDGQVYQRGDAIGNAQVVFSGMDSVFVPNHILAGKLYYFAAFSFNGNGSFRNYKTDAPLLGSVQTPTSMQPADYYNTVSTGDTNFVLQLHNLINPHTVHYYSDYADFMVTGFACRDTSGDQRVVTCVYSGENKVYAEPFDLTSNGFSREHTYCHSWMPTNPAQALPEYSDYHHLFPTNQNQANAVRSNYPLGEVVTPTTTYLGGQLGYDQAGNLVYEPRDLHKGDAARALFYVATCYTGVSGNDWSLPSYISSSIPYGQDQEVLKNWHFSDPPDAYEIARNDYIDSLQGNRNPFVDSVQFACFIDFSTMTYLSGNCIAGLGDLQASISIFPNPASHRTYVHTILLPSELSLLDASGRLVQVPINTTEEGNKYELDISSLVAGTYFLKAMGGSATGVYKLVVLH